MFEVEGKPMPVEILEGILHVELADLVPVPKIKVVNDPNAYRGKVAADAKYRSLLDTTNRSCYNFLLQQH
jgi:hypothetical protein